jgi:hypothetical protein
MRNPDIEKILTEGSTRQKIKLYYTDIAIVNAWGAQGQRLLTKEQREAIYESVKDPKDLKYYDELRIWNRVFLLVKPLLDKTADRVRFLAVRLHGEIRLQGSDIRSEDTLNDILETIDDKATRQKVAEQAIKSMGKGQARIETGKDGLPFIVMIDQQRDEYVANMIEQINDRAFAFKDLLHTVRILVTKYLPLQPYKDYIKREEKLIKSTLEEYEEILSRNYHELRKTDPRYSINDYDSIETYATEEEVDQLRSIGL